LPRSSSSLALPRQHPTVSALALNVNTPEDEPIETADNIVVAAPVKQDLLKVARSILPAVDPPKKLPVPGVPTPAETKLVGADATRFRSRSKYRAWA
jgi:hypothetical protein